MRVRVAAYGLVRRADEILLVHWNQGPLLQGWTLPGGGLEAGEAPETAAVREIFEETGLRAQIGQILGVDSRILISHRVQDPKDREFQAIRIVYTASVEDGELVPEKDGTSDDARWVPLKDLPQYNLLSLVDYALEQDARRARKLGAAG